MKLGKKLLSALMVSAMAISLYSVPAYAQNRGYSFAVSMQNNIAFTAANPKDDNEGNAYVYTQSGNIVQNDSFWMGVHSNPINNSQYNYTGDYKITSNNGRHIFKYYKPVYKNMGMHLKAETLRYGVSVSGYWYS